MQSDDEADSGGQLSFAATVEELYEFADRVRLSRTSLQKVARAPNEKRTYRPLRVTELFRFTKVARSRWAEWSSTNVPPSARGEARYVPVEEMHRMQDELEIRPKRPANKGPLRILVSNFKGGAQKTTLSLHLIHYMGLRGYRVLAVDTDPQGTLTQMMGFGPSEVDDSNTIGVVYSSPAPRRERDMLDESTTPRLRPVKTHLDGVDLLPANLAMTTLDFDIARLFVQGSDQGRSYVRRMEDALAEVEGDYDLVIIDSPPSFSFMAVCLSWVADSLIVPMPTQVPDFAGTGDFCQMLAEHTELVEGWYDRKKVWSPVVFVHARVASGGGSDLVHSKAGSAFGHYRLLPMVPESKPISNCLTVFKSVFEATATVTDSRGLEKAREAYEAICARVEDLFSAAWDLKPVIPPALPRHIEVHEESPEPESAETGTQEATDPILIHADAETSDEP